MSRRRRSRAGASRLWVAAVVGALLGMVAGGLRGSVFVAPGAVDTERWRITSPTLDETVANPGLGRGSHQVGGALVIREHAFHAADTLTPKLTGEPAQVSVAVQPGSGPLMLMLETADTGPRASVQLTATHYASVSAGGTWTARDDTGPWRLGSDASGTYLEQQAGRVKLASGPLQNVQLSALSGEPRVDHISVTGSDGRTLFADDFDAGPPRALLVVAGGALGALWGLALGVAATGGGPVWPLVLGTLPLWFLAASDHTWLGWVERAYLTRTPYWTLAQTVLMLAGLPLALLAVVRTPSLHVQKTTARPFLEVWPAGLVLMAGAGLLASRGGPTLPWWMHALGWGGLFAGPVLVRAVSLDPQAWWKGELPVLVVVAALEWPLGLPVLVAWRGLRVAASARFFLDHAPRAGVNLLLGALVGSVLTAELGVRASYLDTVWRAGSSASEAASDADWRMGHHSWRGRCGADKDTARRVIRIGWAGGSSTGGAFQFEGEPTAFFPAQVHARLCPHLPPGVRLETYNYGHGARDTFTISRTIDLLLRDPPLDLLVLYVGVNDVLTDSGGTTRKEREALRAQAEGWGATQLQGTSRLVTGLGMALRTRDRTRDDDTFVPEVPLADAEENLQRVAQASEGTTRVVLMAELLRSSVDGSLTAYSEMLDQVASAHAHVESVRMGALLAGHPPASLLADRNHFTRAGSELAGAALAPLVAEQVGVDLADAVPSAQSP